MNTALILFAGSGSRIHSELPKQFIKVKGIDMVVYTIKTFNENPHIDEINLVTSKEFIPYVECFKEKYQLDKINKVIEGGATRQESVRLGLEALDYDEDDIILIHDGDRPLVSHALINQAVDYLDEYKASCPYIDKNDVLEEVSNSGRRTGLDGKEVHVQTPQGFRFGLIKQLHEDKKDIEVNDDISLISQTEVKFFPGDKNNFKITFDKDLEHFEQLLEEYEKDHREY